MRARQLLTELGSPDATDLDPAGLDAAGLAAAIAAGVRDGRLPAGIDLPSERDLAAALGRSRGTVARAYERLRRDGLAHTRHGAGTTIGCCAGPWASSRAAELAPVVRPAGLVLGDGRGRTIDLRRARWEPLLPPDGQPLPDGPSPRDGRPPAGQQPAFTGAGDDGAGHRAVTGHLTAHVQRIGLDTDAAHWVLATGRIQALDIALTTLLRPREPLYVPALCEPAVLTLLRVRGITPTPLPMEADGRADVPGWVRLLRQRSARVLLVPSSYLAPAGTVLAAHERRLIAEAAAQGEVTVVEDLSDAELWFDEPPPAPLSTFGVDGGEAAITLASAAPLLTDDAPLAWLRTTNPAVAQQLSAIADALDATPPGWAVAEALRWFDGHAERIARRRQLLLEHAATAVRLITPAAPRLRVVRSAGGPYLWVRSEEPDAVVEAARERGLLLHPGGDWSARGAPTAGIGVTLAAPTDDVVEGLRRLVDAADGRPAG